MKKVLIDAFFHQMPGHRLSRNISVGGYRVNVGRYSPYDVYHPNGASMLISDLIVSYDVSWSVEPFSDMSLASADLLVIPNPDYPLYEGASAFRIDAQDIDALLAYLARGGSVLMLINSFLSRSDFWEENFDIERVGAFFRKLGIAWDPDYMSDDSRILPAKSGPYTVGYGQGGRVLGGLPADAEELLSWNGEIYGFIKRAGRGKLAVIGDAGLVSNGLYGFPGFDNRAFIGDLVGRLMPAFAPGRFDRLTYGSVSCATNKDGITEELFKSLRPAAEYEIDHHYRHLVWEDPRESVGEEGVRLPFELKDIENAERIEADIPFIPVMEGSQTGSRRIPLAVKKTVSGDGAEYFVSGTVFTEDMTWEDIGADPAVFGKIGQLLRVNTVVQILIGTEGGALKWATYKQGQITYDRNVKNPAYGYDIFLASRCAVYAPETL